MRGPHFRECAVLGANAASVDRQREHQVKTLVLAPRTEPKHRVICDLLATQDRSSSIPPLYRGANHTGGSGNSKLEEANEPTVTKARAHAVLTPGKSVARAAVSSAARAAPPFGRLAQRPVA